MRFKRASAALLAAALAVPAMSITAYAEEDAAMKKALTYVKQRIDIPEQCSEFNYSTRTENNGKRYTFTWTLPDDTDYSTFPQGDTGTETISNVRVEITGSVIKRLTINHYGSSGWESSFAKMTNAQLISAAKKYIDEINPTIKQYTVIDEDSLNISLYGDFAYLSFHRETAGVPVTGQTGNVTINKNTGELISYYYNWTNSASFTKPDKAISQSAAQEAYKSLFGSDLNYTLSYDWETKEYTPHLLYTQTSNGQINAFTGRLSTFEDYDTGEITDDDAVAAEAAMDNGVNMTAAYGESKAVSFSDAEIKKMEDESKLISAEKAIKALSEYDFLLIPATADITWENCSYNEMNGYYIRNVSFTAKADDYIDLSGSSQKPVAPVMYDDDVEDSEDFYALSGSFSINAETGELLSYNCYSSDNGTDLTSASGQKTASDAAKTLLGDAYSKFGKLEESGSSQRYLSYDPKTGRGVGEPLTTSRYYSANREEYGIKCTGEYYNITVGNDGYVSSFRRTYHPEVSYPDPANKISADEAYKAFFDDTELALRYRIAYRSEDKKVVSALVYSADRRMYVDALTGKVVNSDGSELTRKDNGEYTDLADSKYKKYAEKLADYGIYLMDDQGRLNESEAITASDLVNLMSNIGMGYADITAAGLKADTKLNRQNAAMLAVMGKYGKEVAELTAAFRVKFSDVPENSKYLGYVAIADAAGWIKGSGDTFNPKNSFTRGEALKMVYTYLARAK